MSNLKQYIKEVLEELEEASVAASISGFSLPLGASPKSGVKYKGSKATDKKHRKDKKKSKYRKGSVQYTLKNN